MSYVSVGRLAKAIKALKRYQPFFGVTFLSMKRSELPVGAPRVWGSDENAFLESYYQPDGAPPGKKFFVPFAGPAQEHGDWKAAKYSGATLQRARTTDNFKDALIHPNRREWAFATDYIEKLKAQLPGVAPDDRLPVNDLAAWLYRNEDIPADVQQLQARFLSDFHITDDELRELFKLDAEDPDQFFFSDPVAPDELAALTGGTPKGASFASRSESDLLVALVDAIRNKHQIILPDGFIESVYYSLKAQPFVVLAGKPGTAKTSFARAFASAMAGFFGGAVKEIAIPIGKEFTEADVVGYEKISGELAATELTKQLLLTERRKDIYIVILDEMNLSEVDNYFARILPAIESGTSVELPGSQEPRHIPTDTFIFGTINSYLDEATRLPLSGPVKRRANIIEMPNHLATIVSSGDRSAFDSAALTLVRQSLQSVQARLGTPLEGAFDQIKADALSTAIANGGRASSVELLDLLWEICQITGDLLTMGVLQDVLDYVCLSHETVIKALDRQIARKIVPQLSGPGHRVEALISRLSAHPNSAAFSEAEAALKALVETTDTGTGAVVSRY
jgi:hypothetical protein